MMEGCACWPSLAVCRGTWEWPASCTHQHKLQGDRSEGTSAHRTAGVSKLMYQCTTVTKQDKQLACQHVKLAHTTHQSITLTIHFNILTSHTYSIGRAQAPKLRRRLGCYSSLSATGRTLVYCCTCDVQDMPQACEMPTGRAYLSIFLYHLSSFYSSSNISVCTHAHAHRYCDTGNSESS